MGHMSHFFRLVGYSLLIATGTAAMRGANVVVLIAGVYISHLWIDLAERAKVT